MSSASVSMLSAPRVERTGTSLVRAAIVLGRDIAQGAAERDRERSLPVAEMAAVKAAGLHAARVPRRFGGAEATWLETSRIVLELARADPNVAQAIQPQTAIIEILRADASEAQQRRWFGLIQDGALITNAIAEQGGAFYGDIATRIHPEDGHYRLQGRKFYATGSAFAEHFYVTALDSTGRSVGAVIPADRPGLSQLDDWNGMGQRTTTSGTVLLEAVRVEADDIVLSPATRDRRWHQPAAAQLVHGAIDTGIALAALDDALVLARTRGRTLREAGVERAVEDPYVLHTLGEISVAASGAKALLERAAVLVDTAADRFFGRTADDETFAKASIAVAEARIASTSASLLASEKLYQVANASGTDRALNLDRHWRNARTHTTHDPLSYKYKFIGDYLLNNRLPPTTAKI